MIGFKEKMIYESKYLGIWTFQPQIDMLQKEVMVILNRKNIAPLVHLKKKNPRLDE